MKEPRDGIPKPIRMIYPQYTKTLYNQKLQDIDWQYKSLELCDQCYKYIKEITDEMEFREEHEVPENKVGRCIVLDD